MLLTFSVYSARSLGDAEEKATKIIRDFLRERKKFEYTLEVLNVSIYLSTYSYLNLHIVCDIYNDTY